MRLPAPARAHAGGVLAVAVALAFNTFNLARNGYANTFYSAAVRSMLRSLHNFFFVSFDPTGLITVDKPPLALWLQAASARVFGFAPLALLLPEALLGALTVLLVYAALRRPFGAVAATGGALGVALFPAFVAVCRDNLPDPLLLALLAGAAYATARAATAGSFKWLAGAAALVGLAFNTKTLAAFIPLPAFALAWLLLAPLPLRRRLAQLAGAGALLAVVSLAWIAAVELTPAGNRPYVGGSLENSELGLTFNYNGFGRLAGEEGAPNEIPYRHGASPITYAKPPAKRTLAIYRPLEGRHPVPIKSEVGPPGPLRLLDSDLGGGDGWILPAAAASALGFLAWALRRRRLAALAQANRQRAATLVCFGGWFVLEAAVLCTARGIVHPYYASALAPGAGALVGAGVAGVAKLPARRAGWLLAVVVAACAAVQGLLLARAGMVGWLAPALAACAAAGLCSRQARARGIGLEGVAAGSLALLLIPAGAYAATTWAAPVQGTFPAAGPHAAAGPGGVGLEGEDRQVIPNLVRYLDRHHPTGRYELLTVSSVAAAPLILLGVRAAALGGYSGTDPALDGHAFAKLVRSGQADYVLLGGPYSERGGNGATRAVLAACRRLPNAAWGGPPPYPYSFVLYRCANRGLALARLSSRRRLKAARRQQATPPQPPPG